MNCLKCGGLAIDERIIDYFVPATMLRCLVCGWVGDRRVVANREASRANGVSVPKFLSEESKARWIESVRRSKAAKRQQQNEDLQQDKEGDNLPLSVKSQTKDVEVHVSRNGSMLVQDLQVVLEERRKDVAVLERAIEILSR